MVTFLAFIFVLGVLIFFHELGHFLVAKKLGIKVERFSLGFPPNIFNRKYGDTTYSIGVIPLGGYVKMAGELPDQEATGAPDEFMSRPVSHRAAVLFAGPFMNYVLAILIMVGLYLFVGVPYYDQDRILVGEVIESSPARDAGLQPGDQIIAVDDQAVSAFDSMRAAINRRVEMPVRVSWLRGGDTLSANIVTRAAEVPDLQGGIDTVGEIGITEQVAGYEKYGVGEALTRGFVQTHVILWETLRFIKQLVTGEVSTKMIGGPVFIAQQSGREARRGPARLFFFMALLSVNLAVLNIQPVIPILDGGQLLFLLLEKFRGSPLPMKARLAAQYFGILAVLSLTLFVTYNDIMRLLGRL